MQKKGLGFLLLAGLLIISALVFLPSVRDSAQAQTGSIVGSVSGLLWGDGVGWVRLNSNATKPVTIENNNLKGYAWGKNIGWIKFDPEGTADRTPAYSTRIDLSGNGPSYTVTGWARACSVFAKGCSGDMASNTARGDWDGWIKMTNVRYNTNSYTFSGYAWAGLLGWVSFYTGSPIIDPNCTPGLDCICDLPNPPDSCDDVPHCEGDCNNGTTPTVTCSVSPATGDNTTTFTWTAVATNLTGTITYTWNGNAFPTSKTGVTVTTSYPTATVGQTFNGQVTATNGTKTVTSVNCSNGVGTGVTIIEPEEVCTFEVTNNYTIPIEFLTSDQVTYSVVNASYPFTITVSGCSAEALDLILTSDDTTDPHQAISFQCLVGSTWGNCTNLPNGSYYLRAGAVYNNIDLSALQEGSYSLFYITFAGATPEEAETGFVRIDASQIE